MELIDKYVWYQEGPGVRKNQYTSSGVKLLNVANLVEGKIDLSTSSRYISEDEANGRYNHFLVDEGDLIIASSGIQVSYFEKKMGIAEKHHLPLCMNTSTIRFKVLDKKITDIRYFMYFLKSNLFKNQIRKLITGSAQLNFGPSHLKKIKIKVPELKKQQEIVRKLDKVKKIIDIRLNQIIELNELIKSQFVEMFGDIKNSIKLGECCSINARIGWQSLTKKEHMETGKYILVTGTDFRNNEIDYTKCVYVSKERYEMDKKIILKNDDILITKDGTIGKVAVVKNLIKPATLNSGIFVVRPDNIFNKEYIIYVFKGHLFKEFINKAKTGATIKHLNQNKLINFEIPKPSMGKQIEFSNIYKQIDKQKFEIEKSLKETQELYESLMEKYFG